MFEWLNWIRRLFEAEKQANMLVKFGVAAILNWNGCYDSKFLDWELLISNVDFFVRKFSVKRFFISNRVFIKIPSRPWLWIIARGDTRVQKSQFRRKNDFKNCLNHNQIFHSIKPREIYGKLTLQISFNKRNSRKTDSFTC